MIQPGYESSIYPLGTKINSCSQGKNSVGAPVYNTIYICGYIQLQKSPWSRLLGVKIVLGT